jgi:hypothetical protein
MLADRNVPKVTALFVRMRTGMAGPGFRGFFPSGSSFYLVLFLGFKR